MPVAGRHARAERGGIVPVASPAWQLAGTAGHPLRAAVKAYAVKWAQLPELDTHLPNQHLRTTPW